MIKNGLELRGDLWIYLKYLREKRSFDVDKNVYCLIGSVININQINNKNSKDQIIRNSLNIRR